MRKLTRAALPLIGAGALVLGGATAALATTVESPPGTAYTGEVKATNIGAVTLSGVSSVGPIVTTCADATLIAYIKSDGTGGELRDVDLTNCTNNWGGGTTITAHGLPYTGGGVIHAPVSGGRDGYIWIGAPNPAVDIEANLDLANLGRQETCHYGLTTTTQLELDVFNAGNPNRPDPGNSHSQGSLNGQGLQLTSGTSGCPRVATANGDFTIVAHPSGDDMNLAP